MRIPGLKSLKLSIRWLRSRFVGCTLILGYHSIGEPVTDAYSPCVTPERFCEQLEVLSKMGRVISLRELVGRLQEGRLQKRTVVLTFDDGYADVLHSAKPLLERYQAPATVFVTTGFLGREFWWDELERVLFSSEPILERLSLQAKDGGYEWVLGVPGRDQGPGSRGSLVQSIYRTLLSLSNEEREKSMLRLRSWVGTASADQPSRRVVTAEELIELASCDLIDIGAHSVTHPFLAALPLPVQRSEIQNSKAYLEQILGRPVTSFAYPNGSSSHETLTVVQESGYHCACASHKDVVWGGSDRYWLPRQWVQDWDGRAFSHWLRLWLPA